MRGAAYLAIGAMLLGGGIAMLWLGRARNGVPLPFLQNDGVVSAYVLTSLFLMVIGLIIIAQVWTW